MGVVIDRKAKTLTAALRCQGQAFALPRPWTARTSHQTSTRRNARRRRPRMSDRDPEPPPEDPTLPPGELVLAEEGGVRVFYISAPTMADLVDRPRARPRRAHARRRRTTRHLQRHAKRLDGPPTHKRPPHPPTPTRLDRTALRILRLRRPPRPRPTDLSALKDDRVAELCGRFPRARASTLRRSAPLPHR
jgi:hypothetical protein